MGSLVPTPAQMEELREAAEFPPPEMTRFQDGEITMVLPPQGLA